MKVAAAAPPSLSAFGAVWFCYFGSIGMFNPYAPLWFKDLGFSTLAIGAIASMQSGTRVVAPYVWGWLADRSGHRVRLIQLAAAATLLAALALLFARGYPAVALVVALLFVANGGVVPLSEAALAQHLQTARGFDSARYGRVRVWGSIGFIVAVIAGGAALQFVGIGWFPLLAALTVALVLGAALRLPAQRDDVSGHAEAPPVLAVLRRPAVAWFFASIFFTVLAHTSLYAFFSLYLHDLGHAESVVGLLWATAVAAEVVFFWFQGRLFVRLPASRWLQWAAALSVLRFAVIAAFGAHLLLLLAAQLLHAMTFAAHHAACIAQLGRHFPGALRGRGQALYSMIGYGVSGVIGGVGGGWLSSALDFRAVFWAAAGAAAIAWVCAVRAQRHDTEH